MTIYIANAVKFVNEIINVNLSQCRCWRRHQIRDVDAML